MWVGNSGSSSFCLVLFLQHCKREGREVHPCFLLSPFRALFLSGLRTFLSCQLELRKWQGLDLVSGCHEDPCHHVREAPHVRLTKEFLSHWSKIPSFRRSQDSCSSMRF